MKAKTDSSETLIGIGPFKLNADRVTLDNGVTTTFHCLRHPGSAAIIPMIDHDSVILLRQYRHALGKVIWEIPAGTCQPDEAPLTCAQRELVEEAGCHAAVWSELGHIIPVPGYSDERTTLFLASGLTREDQQLDADELIEVREVAWDRAVAMATDGTIEDAKTIVALLLADRRRRKMPL